MRGPLGYRAHGSHAFVVLAVRISASGLTGSGCPDTAADGLHAAAAPLGARRRGGARSGRRAHRSAQYGAAPRSDGPDLGICPAPGGPGRPGCHRRVATAVPLTRRGARHIPSLHPGDAGRATAAPSDRGRTVPQPAGDRRSSRSGRRADGPAAGYRLAGQQVGGNGIGDEGGRGYRSRPVVSTAPVSSAAVVCICLESGGLRLLPNVPAWAPWLALDQRRERRDELGRPRVGFL